MVEITVGGKKKWITDEEYWERHLQKRRDELENLKDDLVELEERLAAGDEDVDDWDITRTKEEISEAEEAVTEAIQDLEEYIEEREYEQQQEAEAEWDAAVEYANEAKPDHELGYFASADWITYAKLQYGIEERDLLGSMRLDDEARRTSMASADARWDDMLHGFDDERFWQGWTPEEIFTAISIALECLGRDLREKYFGREVPARWMLDEEPEIYVLATLESWYRDLYDIYETEELDWDTANLWLRTTLYTG
jgi:hypothetical protein